MEWTLTSISAIVVAVGVIAGIILTLQELKHLRNQRQSDLVMRLWQRSCDEDIVRAISRLMSVEYQDYDDYVRKYGHPFSENPMAIAFGMVANFYEGIGIALHRKIIDIDLVSEFWDVQLGWKKVKPLVEGMRKEFDHPGLYEWFEYLSSELSKREQFGDRADPKSGI